MTPPTIVKDTVKAQMEENRIVEGRTNIIKMAVVTVMVIIKMPVGEIIKILVEPEILHFENAKILIEYM